MKVSFFRREKLKVLLQQAWWVYSVITSLSEANLCVLCSVCHSTIICTQIGGTYKCSLVRFRLTKHCTSECIMVILTVVTTGKLCIIHYTGRKKQVCRDGPSCFSWKRERGGGGALYELFAPSVLPRSQRTQKAAYCIQEK